MRKYENVDITAVLASVTEFNTEFYKSDFRNDAAMFDEAAKEAEKSGESRNFYWLSRRSGTVCGAERDVFIKDSAQHDSWTFRASNTGYSRHDTIHAFAVEVTGTENGRPVGNLYELDYMKVAGQMISTALPAESMCFMYKDGSEKRLPCGSNVDAREFLDVSSMRFETGDEAALQSLIAVARNAARRDCETAEFRPKLDAERLRELEIGLADVRMPGEPEKGGAVVDGFEIRRAVYFADGGCVAFGYNSETREYGLLELEAKGGNFVCVYEKPEPDAYKIADAYIKAVHSYAHIPEVTRENWLKNAEMSVEDDYGMIDGIINNGPRETPSVNKKGLTESLAEIMSRRAAHETPDEKPERTRGNTETERVM
jgi:hypothetical protein